MDDGSGHDVLLVEDDSGDAGLVRIAMRRSRHASRLFHVKDGDEAMAFLRSPTEPKPALVLLDLNLPGRGGHEVLEEIRSDPALRALPVVVLSTSGAVRDIRKAYLLGANCYVTKPMDLEAFIAVIHATEDFWFGTARLPS
jgi:CheY-like chemotaxis protein